MKALRLGLFSLLVVLAAPVLAAAQSRGVNDVEVQRYVLPGRVHPNQTGLRVHGSSSRMNLTIFSALRFTGVYFADLPDLILGDGTVVFCIDCTKATPCAGGGGAGAFAKRRASAWDCD